jgi:hypothetical protein
MWTVTASETHIVNSSEEQRVRIDECAGRGLQWVSTKRVEDFKGDFTGSIALQFERRVTPRRSSYRHNSD